MTPQQLEALINVHAFAWDPVLKPMGYEQLTSLSAASALTVPAGARAALIRPEGADIRWRDDATNPTATVGMPISAGESIWYTGDLAAIRLIQSGGTAKANVTYYGARPVE